MKDLPPFEGDEYMNASFTLPDINGAFARFLLDEGCKEAQNWLKRRPVYHLDVKSTEGGLESGFALQNVHIRRVSFAPDTQIQRFFDESVLTTTIDRQENSP